MAIGYLPGGAISVQAASPQANPKMQVRAGFDGYYKQLSWLPIQINLSLPENNPNFEGWLEASFANFDEDSPRYRRSIKLSAPANRTVWLYLPTDNRTIQDVQVRLTTMEGREIENQNQSLRTLNQNEFLLGVISDDGNALSYLNGQQYTLPYNRSNALLTTPRYNTRTGVTPVKPSIRVAHLSAADLPTEGTGWDSLDGLALSDLSTINLSDQLIAQDTMAQAASFWLGQGRLLFVAGDSGLRRGGFLSDLLPVKPSGPPQNIAVPQELTKTLLAFSQSGNLLVAESVALPGTEVAINQNGRPLLAKRAFGLGTSWFAAFDLRTLNSRNGQEVMRYALSDYEPRLSYLTGYRQPADNYRRWANEVSPNGKVSKLPETFIIAIFFGIYIIVIGPGIYFGLRALRKRELGWVVAPAIALVVSLTIYLIGTFTSGDPLTMSRLSVITLGENASGRMSGGTVGLTTIYSNKRTEFRLNGDEQALSLPLSNNIRPSFRSSTTPINNDDLALVIQQGAGGGYGQILMGLSDQRSFASEQNDKAGAGEGIMVRAKVVNNNELEGTIENRSGYDWTDLAVWKPGGLVYNIPLIKNGEKLNLSKVNTVRQNNTDLIKSLIGDTSAFRPADDVDGFLEQKATVLSTLLGNSGDALPKGGNRLYLIAWRQSTTNFPLKIENSTATSNDLTLLFEPISLQP